VIETFKTIYVSDYDKKRTIWILNRTKKKDLELLPKELRKMPMGYNFL
jgi:hypothetical protein